MHRPIAKLIALASFVAGIAACTSPTAPSASPLGASARQAEPGDVRHEPQPRDKHHEPEPGDNRGRGRGNDDGPGHH
jgi:hypothetical protein